MILRSLGWSLSVALVALVVASAQAADPPAVEFREEVEYGTGDGEKLTLNLAKPAKADGKLPVLVYIHGGGWAGGNKRDLNQAIKDAAARGYLAVSVGYRLAPKHLFPAQVEDAKCAVRWLRAHADELGIDPNRIGAVGFSAGAHLAMMLGFMDPGDGLEGSGGWPDQSSKVQAVVAYFGPTNLDAEYPETSRAIVRNFIGGTREEKRETYQKASPITYADQGDAPLLIFHGTKDVLVPHDQAIQLVDRLSEAGVPGRIEIMLGANHGWGGKELERTLEGTNEFFDEILKPGK